MHQRSTTAERIEPLPRLPTEDDLPYDDAERTRADAERQRADAAEAELALMRIGDLDASLDLPVESLTFVSWLMPPAAALDLRGRGRLRGRLVLAAGEMLRGTDLSVEARELAMGFGAYGFSGDGAVDLRVDPKDESQADLAIRFDRVAAELVDDDADTPDRLFTGRGLSAVLHAAEVDPATTSTAEAPGALLAEVDLGFALEQARLSVPLSPVQVQAGAVQAVAGTMADDGFGAVLATADGEAAAKLTVSALDWIAALLGRPLDLAVQGSGELDAAIVLADGWPAAGSALRMPKEALSVALLDYRIDGTGTLSLELLHGDQGPRARLGLALADARARRRDEAQPSVDAVRMDAELLVQDPFAESVEDAAAGAELKATIHTAAIPDMRIYNPYLPVHGPVAFTGGAARLAGDLALTADSASGELLFTANDVGVQVADAELAGDLRGARPPSRTTPSWTTASRQHP